jgi:hypothetical protein
MKKRGQGLPLNTIIVAIIVLVVLVVLIAIFTGRIGIFEKQVDEQSKIELLRFQPSYGACHPTASEEQKFLSALADAKKDGNVDGEATARTNFQNKISTCNDATANCAGATGCTTS